MNGSIDEKFKPMTPLAAEEAEIGALRRALRPGVVAGWLSAAMWGADFFGHWGLGSFFHSPATAHEVNTIVACALALAAGFMKGWRGK